MKSRRHQTPEIGPEGNLAMAFYYRTNPVEGIVYRYEGDRVRLGKWGRPWLVISYKVSDSEALAYGLLKNCDS